MSIKIVKGSAEIKTFVAVTQLNADITADLANTVGAALIANSSLSKDHKKKIDVALNLLSSAYQMLESCGCKIETKIDNPNWSDSSSYKTQGEI